MERLLAIFLAIWMLLPVTAQALSQSPKAEFSSGAYTARILEDGTCEIVGCSGWNAGVLPIPSRLEGKKVTSIGDGVFEDFWNVDTFLLPEGLTHIGSRAFFGCETARNIRLPESLVSIGEYAFSHCSWSNLQIPDGVSYIGEGAFSDCRIDWIEGAYDSALMESEDTYAVRELEDGTCEIVGFSGNGGNLVIPQIIREKRVSAIGKGAFSGLSNLDTVVIPEGIEKIGDGAFRNCGYLTEVSFPKTLEVIGKDAFADCGLISAALPEGLVSIGDRAFRHCTALMYISIPESTENLGRDLLEGCGSLAAVLGCAGSDAERLAKEAQAVFGQSGQEPEIFGCGAYTAMDLGDMTCVVLCFSERTENKDGLEEKVTIPKTLEGRAVAGLTGGVFDAFDEIECLQIPPTVMSIGADAFANVSEVVIPNNLVLTGMNPFSGYETYCALYFEDNGRLKVHDGLLIDEGGRLIDAVNISGNIIIPDGVTSIGDGAFMNCSEIDSVVMPAGVASIGAKAFAGCESLKHVVLSDALTNIGDLAFYGCGELENLEIPRSVVSWGSNPFAGVGRIQIEPTHPGIRMTGGLLIDEDEKRVLYAQPGIESITVPDGVECIGDYAFAECSDLQQIVLPMSLSGIGDGAFYGNLSLESVELPENVESVGCSAFESCHNMTALTIRGSHVTMGRHALVSCDSLERVTILGTDVGLGEHAVDSGIPGNMVRIKEIAGYPGSGAGELAQALGADFAVIQ